MQRLWLKRVAMAKSEWEEREKGRNTLSNAFQLETEVGWIITLLPGSFDELLFSLIMVGGGPGSILTSCCHCPSSLTSMSLPAEPFCVPALCTLSAGLIGSPPNCHAHS